nr:MAG TPA: hypothetical protein [Caudoviricetes sp.]
MALVVPMQASDSEAFLYSFQIMIYNTGNI